MTATSLGLGGQPVKFLGAYVKNVSSNLGLSTSPSTITVTLVEDDDAQFIYPTVGDFYEISVGPTWRFGGIITRYELDLANIGGRTIRVNMSDPREIMKSIPVILAPGSESIVDVIEDTGCSVIDVFGAFQEAVNLSEWNEAGMPWKSISIALRGEQFTIGTAPLRIEQQIAKAFGELYRFNVDELDARIDPEHRVNTNLNPLSNLFEDLSGRNAFDWFVEATRAQDGIIDVTIRLIDRSTDNIDIGLQDFLDLHPDKVITASSGIELRNDTACIALQGALVEQMTKVEILGLANEPVDLSVEGGTNAYFMEETEMRALLAGRQAWEIWLGMQRDFTKIVSTIKVPRKDEDGNNIAGSTKTVRTVEITSRGGFSRYGKEGTPTNPDLGNFEDDWVGEAQELAALQKQLNTNIPIFTNRVTYIAPADQQKNRRAIVGAVFDKLSGHAKATYGKRFVHNDIGDEVIQSVWTRDVVAAGDAGTALKNKDPNEYFRQEDGRTRAYVEFSLNREGGAFSLGLNDLTNLFGDLDIFRNVTRFGTTFKDRSGPDAVISVELAGAFDPGDVKVDIQDAANYVYKNAAQLAGPDVKTSLFVACSVSKDGVVSLPGGVFEKEPSTNELLQQALESAQRNLSRNAETPADKAELTAAEEAMQKWWGNSNTMWGLHARCYQPDFVYVPTRSRILRYGPVFSRDLGGESQGKLQIIQDDGFAPWEFGSIGGMITAMQIKVDNATSLQREAFSASIQVEGYPILNIGDSLEKNSNINSITMNFGDGGVKTSYALQTYLRKFGEISKEDLARLSLILNSGGARILAQKQSSFISGYNVSVAKEFIGGFQSSSSNMNGGALDFG